MEQMMNVSINEEQISNKTEQVINPMQVIDSRGRVLKLRKLDILSESRLVRMLGQDTVTNSIYMNGYVIPAVMVSEIDGEALFLPMSERQMEALIQRLDNDGLEAVLNYLQATVEDKAALESQLKK